MKRAGFIALGLQDTEPTRELFSFEKDPEISINITETTETRTVFELQTEHGRLDAIFHRGTRWFGISNIDVELGHRRFGIGKALLRKAYVLALENDAVFIHAGLVSREVIDAMHSVFGERAVKVTDQGTYAPKGSAHHHDAGGTLGLWLK